MFHPNIKKLVITFDLELLLKNNKKIWVFTVAIKTKNVHFYRLKLEEFNLKITLKYAYFCNNPLNAKYKI